MDAEQSLRALGFSALGNDFYIVMWTGTVKVKAISFRFQATQISCLQSRKSNVQESMINIGKVLLWGQSQ